MKQRARGSGFACPCFGAISVPASHPEKSSKKPDECATTGTSVPVHPSARGHGDQPPARGAVRASRAPSLAGALRELAGQRDQVERLEHALEIVGLGCPVSHGNG